MEGRWKRERAADKLERRVLGRSREVDLFQALKISDPEAVSNEDLKAYEVSPMTLAGGPLRPGENRYLEALNPKASVSFQYRVTVDRAVFSQRQNSDGRRAVEALFRDREAVLVALRSFSRTLIEAERKFYSDSGARDLLRRFDEIMKQAEGRIAIPFGFGSGWQGKTMGLLLTAPDLNRLAPLLSPGRSYYRRGGQPVFPKTRRWVLEAGRPVEPLGWVLVE